MFLKSVIKMFSRFFPRRPSTKRPRNPTTFQECMDQPEQPQGYWKPAVFILLLVPTIYYMFYFRGNSESKYTFGDSISINEQKLHQTTPNSNSVENIPEPKPIKKKWFRQVFRFPKGISLKALEVCKQYARTCYIRRGCNTAKNYDVSIVTEKRAMLPADLNGLNLCTTIAVTNTENVNGTIPKNIPYASSNELFAHYLGIKMGGHFIPKDCRSRHKVAMLVSYGRNGLRNLKTFLHYIHPFLIRQKLEYRIFVVGQDGNGDALLNKGRLYNAGFLEIQKNDNWQCVIFHDIDLLPADNRIRYTCPVIPRHMCAAVVGKENIMIYNSVFDGVTAMTMWHYKKANGYSNLYWGSGESEDMFKRLQAAGLGVTRYKKQIAKYIALKHAYRPDNPNRTKLLVTATDRYKKDGLSSLSYNLVSYASNYLYTHIVVSFNHKKSPDYITEGSVTLSP